LGVVIAYIVVFWVVLPAVLWTVARAIDTTLGWQARAWWGGAVVAAAGLLLLGWGIAALWRRGEGLPISALPPPKLVARGPYRLVRHPIYLGFSVFLFGWGLLAGSPGLTMVVAPLFLPVWVGYALVEERGLVRRFGQAYLRYRRLVGLFPRLDLFPLLHPLCWLGVIRVKATGREHLAGVGGAVLVINHSCYIDPVFAAAAVRPRRVWFITTAEAYRKGIMGWAMRHLPTFPVHRFRIDPIACREMLRFLAEGELVGVFPERERSVHGAYLGSDADTARILARLPVPAIPVVLSGAYDVGPRWASILRVRTVHARIGPPIRWGDDNPVATLDSALRALMVEDPQRVHLEGLPLERLGRAVWRCPTCLEEDGWNPEVMRCDACGARFAGTEDGRIADEAGTHRTFAEWVRPVWEAEEREPLEAEASGWRDPAVFGPIRPLEPLGNGQLHIDRTGLRFGELFLPIEAIRSATTERADTLQVATDEEMWQFRNEATSPFRLQNALHRWRARHPSPES
jgi:1-acyl-sn-glycerol-3-phosphate acyltransferase/isoprenylcysteine carboxyl methyltransferase (ICMT) family protein YpbQ